MIKGVWFLEYRYGIVLLSCLFLAVACANKPERNGSKASTFLTDINDDGSKRFSLAMSHNEANKGKGKRSESREQGRSRPEGGRGGGGKGGRSGNGERQASNQQGGSNSSQLSYDERRAAILGLLDQKLAETNYCRNGYIELDFTSVSDKTEIRGECQESASADDKKRFGN